MGQLARRDPDAGVLDLDLELGAGGDHPGDHAPAPWGEANGVGDQVDDHLEQPVLVAQARELVAGLLALQDDAGLVGPRPELVHGARDDRSELEPRPLDRQDARAQARDLQDLVHEPEQAIRAGRDDLDEPPLPVGERTGDALAQEVGALADGGERRPQLVGDRREELLLRPLEASELEGHRVERARELADLVPALHLDRPIEVARRDLGGGGRERPER